MVKVVPEVLSDKAAIDQIIHATDSKNIAAVKHLKESRQIEPDFNPVVELMSARRALPYSSNMKLLEKEKSSRIAADFLSEGNRLGILDDGENSHNTKVNAVAQLLAVISSYYQINRLSHIDLNIWEDFVSQVKMADSSFNDELNTVQVNAIRLLAKTLAGINEDKLFSSLIAKKRQRDYAHNRSHITIRFELWEKYFDEWVSGVLIKSIKDRRASFNKFRGYLATFENASDPLVFLTHERAYSFWKYLEDNKIKNKRASALQMNEFVNWIIDEYLTEEDSSGDATIAYPLLTAKEVNRVLDSNDSATAKPPESVKHAMPTKWLMLCKDILADDDYAWPKSLPYEYIDYFNPETKSYEKVWTPVCTCLYQIMCELPLRRIQVKSLDSGEGDSQRYTLEYQSWGENNSEHSLYWSDHNEGETERGFVRKIISSGKETVGFYINTNKTQDRSTGFSDKSGYVVPWNNESLIKIYDFLRAWQEKYNPVELPQKYKDIPARVWSTEPSELVKELIPDRFYLFRSLLHEPTGAPAPDAHLNRFWFALMEELELRLNEQGDNVQIITKRDKHNAPKMAIFTPHSLRVSGLTAFVEAGVPIEVLSKVVAGHASILMTLYYVKFSHAHVSEVLSKAQKTIEDTQQLNFSKWLKNAAWTDANKYSVFNDPISVKTIYDTKDTLLWENNQIGICPNAGTRCDEGGKLVRKNGKGRDIYAEVPGGTGNCVRCRFFITGKPWLIPLWLHGNKLFADSRKSSFYVEKARQGLEELRSDRKKILKEKGAAFIPPEMKANIKAAEGLLDRKTAELDHILCNAHATSRLIEGIRAIDLSGDKESNFPVPLDSDVGETEFLDQHHFRQQNLLVQASRLYPHIQDDDLENDRNHFIDKVMFQSGLTPISLSNLTAEEVKNAADALSTFLVAKLTDSEMQLLEQGAVTLDELGLKSDAVKATKQLGNTSSHLHNSEQVE